VSSRLNRKEEKKKTQSCKGARTQGRKVEKLEGGGGLAKIAVKIAVRMQVERQGDEEIF